MKRLQIIIFSTLSVFLLLILSGQSDNDFNSDYDLRFVCGFKIEINPIPVEFKFSDNNEEESILVSIDSATFNQENQSELVSGLNEISYNRFRDSDHKLLSDRQLKSFVLPFLLSPRSPPLTV